MKPRKIKIIHKRKLLDLSPKIWDKLSIQASISGTDLKPYIERILTLQAHKKRVIDDSKIEYIKNPEMDRQRKQFDLSNTLWSMLAGQAKNCKVELKPFCEYILELQADKNKIIEFTILKDEIT